MADFTSYKWVEGYDCNDPSREHRPDLVAYQPIFAELNDNIAQAVELLRTPVQKSQFSNVMTKSLLDETHFRTDARLSDRVMFAVVGDMGSGISSQTCYIRQCADLLQAKALSSTQSWVSE